MHEKEQRTNRPRLSPKDPCQLSSSHPSRSCRASGESSSWGTVQGGKIDSEAWREMFCLPIQLSISGWCPEGPAGNRATQAISPSYPNVPLYLLVASEPTGSRAVEQDGPGVGALHSCPTHVWAKGFERWRRRLLCGGHSWIRRRIYSCCLLERPKRETNRKRACSPSRTLQDLILLQREHNGSATQNWQK